MMTGGYHTALIIERYHERAHVSKMVQFHKYAADQSAYHIIGIELIQIPDRRYGRYAVNHTNGLLQVTAELEPMAPATLPATGAS